MPASQVNVATEYWQDWELTAKLTSLLQQRPELSLYGLLDGTSSTNLDAFFQLAPITDYQPLFRETEYATLLPASPYLIAPSPADCDFLNQWGCQAAHQVIWYLSSLDMDVQIHHWRSLLHVITPEQSAVLFRFWDGAVFAPFLNACRPAEQSALLAPCQLVLLPIPPRRWQVVWTVSPQSSLAQNRDTPWWQLQPHQLAHFSHCFDNLLAEQVLDELWRTHSRAMGQTHPAAAAFLMEQALTTARAQGSVAYDTVLRMVVKHLENAETNGL